MRRRLRSHPRFLAAVLLLAAGVLVACGEAEDPEATPEPAPGREGFVEGDFDDVPVIPRAEPVGPAVSREEGTVARTYKVQALNPRQSIQEWGTLLSERDWDRVEGPREMGQGIWRSDWLADDRRLELVATPTDAVPADEATPGESSERFPTTVSVLLYPDESDPPVNQPPGDATDGGPAS